MKKENPKKSEVGFNLIHILMMQTCVKHVYENAPDSADVGFMNVLTDVLHILELTIDNSDNETLKNAVQYEPVKIKDHGKIQPKG